MIEPYYTGLGNTNILKKDDEYFMNGRWSLLQPEMIGKKVKKFKYEFRRRLGNIVRK